MSAPSEGGPPPSISTNNTLKRTYLSLIPASRLIDLCLALDAHVPTSLSADIWPTDLAAAISYLRPGVPLPPLEPKIEPTSTPLPPPPPEPAATTPPAQAKAASPPPPAFPALTYFPAGSSHHQPYYAQAPSFVPPPPPSNAFAPPAQPMGMGTPTDLPSYEDMIVEGLSLLGAGDPEGAAPKTLFNWMGSRWPLQINFRPSASQALQKAYKRGRLEKAPSGKYRLNPTWGGGSTSRRTTRRPQTQTQAAMSIPPPPQPGSASPFTRAPLGTQSPTPGPSELVASSSIHVFHTPVPPQEEKKEEDAAASAAADAWEAAQRILKTFQGMAAASSSSHNPGAGVGTPGELGSGKGKEREEDCAGRRALQEQLALLARQMAEIAEGEGLEGDIGGEMMAGWGTGEARVKEEDVEMSLLLGGEAG